MVRSNTIGVLVLILSMMVLILGCEGDHTAPERGESELVDPVDWDGTKEGRCAIPVSSDGPSHKWARSGFEPREHRLGSELKPQDHTIIMEAILHNAREIAARLPQNQVSSGMEVLEAALVVPDISSYTKSRISLVLDVLPLVDEAQGRVPEETQQAMAEVLEELENCEGLSDMAETLERMIDSGRYDTFVGMSRGLDVGLEILRDGERTVYAPRCLFNLKRTLRQDLSGAIGGAIGGAIVGGAPGAGVGAIAGSAGASGADAIGQLTGWW